MNPFPEEEYPKHIKYVLNNAFNRTELFKMFGGSKTQIGNCAYIEINLEKNHWWYSPDYAWLYRNQPPISTLEELNICLRKHKINIIKNEINRT